MTAEIAILNKSAIALAADSAITIGEGADAKIYNTGEVNAMAKNAGKSTSRLYLVRQESRTGSKPRLTSETNAAKVAVEDARKVIRRHSEDIKKALQSDR